jgi:hypothetical protein
MRAEIGFHVCLSIKGGGEVQLGRQDLLWLRSSEISSESAVTCFLQVRESVECEGGASI